MASSPLWSINGTYLFREGNDIDILIDGQAAYSEISNAFYKSKKFIYLTISYGAQDFFLVPGADTFFNILRNRRQDKVDVRMVVWEPAESTPDTIPDPTPVKIPGVNDGPECIQARWDHAKGYTGTYKSPQGLFESWPVYFPDFLGCHHQKTYIMDDGEDSYVAFVGGINPVQCYWDTPDHDVLNKGRVKSGVDIIKGLEDNPPLHDIFYKIKGPAVFDVLSNFIERFNGASIPYSSVTFDVVPPVTIDQIPAIPDGIEAQVVRTIAPDTYPSLPDGDQGIRELYFNMLGAAGDGSLVYIENQYFFDHGVVAEIREAAERGAKVIVVLTSKPDEGMLQGRVESILEEHYQYGESLPLKSGHENVGFFTLGNHKYNPQDPDKLIVSETYIHSKNMAVIGADWAIMTGGSANIAFTSMWFHSEMNVVFTDITRIKSWVAKLWSEHLSISIQEASELIQKPDDALAFFRAQAASNTTALTNGKEPKGRIYQKDGTDFPARDLTGINLDNVNEASTILTTAKS